MNFEIQEPSNHSHLSDEKIQTLVQENDETLDAYEGELDEDPDVLVKDLSSVPCLLERVYREELVNGSTLEDHKLLIVAVHAVFLESGFICFNSVKKKKIDGFLLPEGWASKTITLSVQYTLPQLLSAGNDTPHTVNLKFQTMGKLMLSVYGSLRRQKPLAFFRLDASRFVPSIKFVCVSMDVDDVDSSSKLNHEKEVFELWKIAKDGLALPLLIDLCDKTRLESPPCFMCLPTDLKLKILEFLPGIDIAKVGCVSSELKYLCSNNELWKLKYMEEFSLFDSGDNTKDRWKEKYVTWRESKSRQRRPVFKPFPYSTRPARPDRIIWGDPNRFPAPFGSGPARIIGGDYDVFPAPSGSVPTRSIGGDRDLGRGQGFRFPARRSFVPHCDLGGFDA